ncbi:hypothetical protein CMV_002324 [Castanea mollissima]|uniref:Uncharacterized protein n=1 Tax=Castanea mollissima TaxID=60419 RepID=A0A8J4VXM2_9ROSI|nr:hypothetical protein CMV_002324 [Castanea mollissima]
MVSHPHLLPQSSTSYQHDGHLLPQSSAKSSSVRPTANHRITSTDPPYPPYLQIHHTHHTHNIEQRSSSFKPPIFFLKTKVTLQPKNDAPFSVGLIQPMAHQLCQSAIHPTQPVKTGPKFELLCLGIVHFRTDLKNLDPFPFLMLDNFSGCFCTSITGEPLWNAVQCSPIQH